MKQTLVTCLLFLVATPALAATLHFISEPEKAGVGDVVRVSVLLDSPEGVNALQGKLHYSDSLLELKKVSDGNSIVSFWIVPPRKLQEQSLIEFAGAIPGGYGALDGKILEATFLVKKSGAATLRLSDALTLLNDGQGTAAKLSLPPLQIALGSQATGVAPIEPKDTLPPEPFTVRIASDPNIFEDNYFLVFATQDKGSGVDHYETAEMPGVFKPRPSEWQKAESPYLLTDQSLKKWIFVKAVDGQGNERIAILEPANAPFYARPRNIILLLIAVMLLLEIWRRAVRRKK